MVDTPELQVELDRVLLHLALDKVQLPVEEDMALPAEQDMAVGKLRLVVGMVVGPFQDLLLVA